MKFEGSERPGAEREKDVNQIHIDTDLPSVELRVAQTMGTSSPVYFGFLNRQAKGMTDDKVYLYFLGSKMSMAATDEDKPRIKSIRGNLTKAGFSSAAAHIEIVHGGQVQYCYPAEVCLAILEYYAFDAGSNCQPEARDNFRLLAGSKLRELPIAKSAMIPRIRSALTNGTNASRLIINRHPKASSTSSTKPILWSTN
jgi:hypothetical protein